MNRLRRLWIPVLLTAVALAGCDDDDGDDGTTTTPDAGMDGGTMDGGRDASTGDAGDASVALTPVQCGATTCPVVTVAGQAPAQPCCAAGNVCSAIRNGVCGPVAVRHATCGDVVIPPVPGVFPTGLTVSGCCTTTDTQCGLDYTQLGYGCRSLASPETTAPFAQLASLGVSVTVPPAQTCPPLGDGGVGDGGTDGGADGGTDAGPDAGDD